MSIKTVTKPWGKEEWLELNDAYCYKRIYINAGYKTSFQYHEKKRETNYLISGKAEVWLENDMGEIEKKIFNAGEFFNVLPPKKHRVIALTDIILQEVSTPEVNDVIRIEDDANRKDGLIEGEHTNPAVLILAAGLGSRLKYLTANINKALIPINNKAIISYIIEKFPSNYDLVIATGYKEDSLIEYCNLVHSDRKITYVHVDKWQDSKIGPGYTALQCESYLQRPFYITTADCIIDDKLPYLDGNWLGVSLTGIPEKYSTIKIDTDNNVVEFVNKTNAGFDNAFIGLASILDYKIFWEQLRKSKDTELISAWVDPKAFPTLKVKHLNWFDTGNLDDIKVVKDHYKDVTLSLYKTTGEITYKYNDTFYKFNPEITVTSNRYDRGMKLSEFIPSNLSKNGHFLAYSWEDGMTLYNYNSTILYSKFLDSLLSTIKNDKTWNNPELIKKFYMDKTLSRMNSFISKYGDSYYTMEFIINSVKYPSMKSLIEGIDVDRLTSNLLYSKFHGDLQFDNIIYNSKSDKFTYIDWRESFAGNTDGGTIYYDLSKLYGGCLIPYNLIKNEDNIEISEGSNTVTYSIKTTKQLSDFISIFKEKIAKDGYSIEVVKLITGLIYLGMSPLHSDTLNKILWFKSIEMISNANK